MDYLELSLKNVKEKTSELFFKIKESKFDYDLVVFIAKGSYYIGKTLSELNDVPLIEIYAQRKGGKVKKILKPILKIIPKKILIKLRKREMTNNYHEKNNDRFVSYDKDIYEKYKNCKTILLVDDSIDSGNSIILTKNELLKYFENSEIKVAVFNVMDKSIIKPEYSLYRNTMICGPWSNDSKENKKHEKMYFDWKEGK